jgi:hypothetical protein
MEGSVKFFDVLTINQINKGIAHVRLARSVHWKVEKVVPVLEQFVDFVLNQTTRILVRDILDHQSCPHVPLNLKKYKN